jgi:hypothetical protein
MLTRTARFTFNSLSVIQILALVCMSVAPFSILFSQEASTMSPAN